MIYKNLEGVPNFISNEYARKKTKYCILIPIINEGDRIANELLRAQKAGIDNLCDIIICDGGSNDGGTEEHKLKSLGVNALLTKTGTGKQGAQLRMGIWFALNRGYAGVITIDGNDKDSIEDVPSFIDKLEGGYDFVQGSRFIRGGKAINTPLIRYLSVRFIHAPVISITARKWFTDTTNAYRAYSTKYLTHPQVKPLREIFITYELLAYLSVRASQLKLKTCEVPVTRKYPSAGKTPTKISFFKGNGNLLQILFKNLMGYYNPSPTRINPFNMLGFILILGAGVSFIYALTVKNDFWIDEAMVVQSIFTRNFSELASSPLDYSQNAPLGYAYIVKVFSIILGETTLAARLPAVLAAFGTMLFAFRIAKDLFKSNSPLFYAGAISLSTIFFSYATQAKQYTLETMAVLAVIWLAGMYWQGKLKLVLLATIFAIITWLSFVSIFFMFTTIAVIIICNILRLYRKDIAVGGLIKLCLPFLITLISVILNLFLWIIPATSSVASEAHEYWDKLAFPLLPSSVADIKLIKVMADHLINSFSIGLLALGLAFILILFDRVKNIKLLKSVNMLAIYSALVFGLIASYLGYLPMQDRIWIFIYPLGMMGVAWACDNAQALFTSKMIKNIYIATICIIFTLNLIHFSQQKYYVRARQQLSTSLQHVEDYERPEDFRYVSYSATPQYNYLTNYKTFFTNHLSQNIAISSTIYGSRVENSVGEGAYQYKFTPLENHIKSDVEAIASNNRVWLLFAHTVPREKLDNPQWQLLKLLDEFGSVTLEKNIRDTPLYLFEKD